MTDPQRPAAASRPDRLARALSGIAIAVAVIGVVAAVVRQGDDDPDTASPSSTTSTTVEDDSDTSSSSTSSTSTSTTSSTIDPLTTTTAGPTTTTSTTAPAAGACRNSRESQFAGRSRPAGCGAFAWDPTPRNQPASITLSGPAEVRAGQTARFTIEWSDADAPVGAVSMSGFGEGCLGDCTAPTPPACTDKPIGKWDAPPKAGGADTATIDATGLAPGSYQWTATVATRSAKAPGACLTDPWASTVSATGTLVVKG